MTDAWLLLAVAGAGALHGLNPAAGWGLAAACGVRSGNPRQALRALVPIGIGHAVSTAMVAAAVALGLSMDRTAVQFVAGGLLAGIVVMHFAMPRAGTSKSVTGKCGLALGSFLVSSVHATGLMLVPAQMPMCIAGRPLPESNVFETLSMASMATAVHVAAMLATTGLVAAGICGGIAMHRRG